MHKTTFNTENDWLVVNYKLSRLDRLYGASPSVVEVSKGKRPDATLQPYDTATLAPHSTWHLPAGAQVVDERVLSD